MARGDAGTAVKEGLSVGEKVIRRKGSPKAEMEEGQRVQLP